MSNLRNFGIIEGRLARDPKVFVNRDGSRKIMVTVMVKRNYKTSENGELTYKSDAVDVEGFVPAKNADKKSVFDYMHKGDAVAIGFTVASNVYIDKNTQAPVYAQVLRITDVDLQESRTVTEARAKARMSTTQEQAQPAEVSPIPDEWVPDEGAYAIPDDEDAPF